MITKTERNELRSIVRQQFKVLRAEVHQRTAELIADLDEQIADRYKDEDEAWGVAVTKANEAALEANRAINDIFRDLLGPSHGDRVFVQAVVPRQPRDHRALLVRTGMAHLTAQGRAAILRLDREEADLLRKLAIGALESEEAHAFLGAIPTVGQLVSSARLAELEASLGPDEG